MRPGGRAAEATAAEWDARAEQALADGKSALVARIYRWQAAKARGCPCCRGALAVDQPTGELICPACRYEVAL